MVKILIQNIVTIVLLFFLHADCRNIIRYDDNQIPFCKVQSTVATLSDQDNLQSIKICKQCTKMRVLSANYLQCLHVREELGSLNLANCKRLNMLGQCAEALDGIEIIDNKYSWTASYFLDDRCAVVSKNYESCLSPRFGFILDVKKQKIYKDHRKYPTFCQLYDSFIGKCIKYFDYFIPSEKNNGLSVYLDNFQNANLVDSIVSSAERLICIQNYIYDVGLGGCYSYDFAINYTRKIVNCMEVTKRKLCKKCESGYSLRTNFSSCNIIVTSNCLFHEYIDGQDVCVQCKPFYKIWFLQCIPLTNCKRLHPLNSNICVACESPYQLDPATNSCEKKERQIFNEAECQLFSGNGECMQCKDNNIFYLQNNFCLKRQNSLYCLEQDPKSDSCITLECISERYFAQLVLIESFNFNQEVEGIQQAIQKNILKQKLFIKNPYTIICIQRLNYPIPGCRNYHPITDTCQRCQDFYYSIRSQWDIKDQQYDVSNVLITQLNGGNTSKFRCQNSPIYKRKFIQNCITYSQDGIVCIKCKSGFYESEAECIKGIDNCFLHQNRESCLQCEKGFIPIFQLVEDNILYNIKCIKNENLRSDSIVTGSIQTNPFDSIMKSKSNCGILSGFIFLQQEQSCISDTVLPNCQTGEYNSNKILRCNSCSMEFDLYQNYCYAKKLFTIEVTNNNQSTIQKKCNSLIHGSSQSFSSTTSSSSICQVNIEEGIVISDESIFGELNEYPKFNFEKCKFQNCQKCEYDKCLKCNQFYKLTKEHSCQRVCKNMSEEECIKVIQGEKEEVIQEEEKEKDDEKIKQEEEEQNQEEGDEENKKKKSLNKKYRLQIETLEMIFFQFIALLILLLLISIYRYFKNQQFQKNIQEKYYCNFNI